MAPLSLAIEVSQETVERRSTMKPEVRWTLPLLILMAVSAACSEGASTLRFTAVPVATDQRPAALGRIYAGSQGVMTLGGHGAKSVTEAAEVARRLNALAEAGLAADDITVRRERRSYIIMGGATCIVQVDPALARTHRTAPDRLARMWAANLAAQFGQPYLSVRSVVVPVGETRRAPIKGNIFGLVRVRSETDIVTASYEGANRALRVLGQRPGRTELVISDDRSVLRLPVRAAKYAGHLTGSVAAGVSGTPATGEVVSQAVRAAVASSLVLEPGAWASIEPSTEPVQGLVPGSSAAVPVQVSAAGPDYLPYRVRRLVTVWNEGVAADPVEVLMVSNSPERLLSHGMWFEGSLREFRSARLLYHHVNGMSSAADLLVEVVNLADRPGRVHVIVGKGGPSRDESWAGHRATLAFMRNRLSKAGWVIPIPPESAAPVLVQRVTAGATASGVLELRSLSASDFRVRCHLAPPRSSWLPYPVRSYHPSPALGRWHFPLPRKQIQAKYEVKRDWAFVTIGDQAVSGVTAEDRLAGNYGVVYDIKLEISNPTNESSHVEVLLEPGGGPARGTVVVDGRLAEVSLLKRDSEAVIARYSLAPGEARTLAIQTMPQSGSNYPVRLVARGL